VNKCFESLTGVLIAAGIHKGKHVKQYAYPDNPYSIALLFCLERMYAWLKDAGMRRRNLLGQASLPHGLCKQPSEHGWLSNCRLSSLSNCEASHRSRRSKSLLRGCAEEIS
jgi:hypothetical protein